MHHRHLLAPSARALVVGGAALVVLFALPPSGRADDGEALAYDGEAATAEVAPVASGAPAEAPAAVDAGTAAAPDWREIAPGLRVGGSLRLRFESQQRFDLTTGFHEDFLLSQARVHLTYTPTDWLTLFVEGQHADIQGQRRIDEDAVPNIFADRFDLHQGYAEVRADPGVPVRVRVGRQKLALGRERLVSPLEWVNTARVFDAARITLGEVHPKQGGRALDLFASRAVPVDPRDFNDWSKTGHRHFDSSLYGVTYQDHATIPWTRFELYALWRNNDRVSDEVYTVGGRVWLRYGVLDAELEGAWQGGRFGGLTHRAGMLFGEVGLTAPVLEGLRFAGGYSWGSGDEDPDDGRHTTFDNLFPLGHAYWGFMDFFSLQNLHEARLLAELKPCPGLAVRLAAHAFWLDHARSDAWYHAGLGVKRAAPNRSVSSYVGSEVDATVTWNLFEERAQVQVGYSRFFAGSYTRDTGGDRDAQFVYVQLLLKL